MCLKLRSVELKKKISIGKKILLLLFFRSSHTHPERERETWSLPLLLACVSVAFEHPLRLVLRPLPDRHGLRKMNKESGNELLIKLSNSKEGKDRTLFYYYHPDRVILKNNFWNVFYSIAVLQSNIWNIRLTLEQQTGKGQERALSKDKYHHLSWEHLWKGQKQTNCFSS